MDTCSNISWLASYPKSGNTWVRMFINAFLSGMPLNINCGSEFCKLDKDPAMLQLITPTPIKTLTQSEQFIYRQVMLLNMLKTSRDRLYLKTHFAKVAVDGTHVIPLPVSDCAVYLVRDPRDVAISLSHHMGYSVDETIEFMNNMKQGIVDESTNMTDLLLTWSEHVKSWTFNNQNLDTFVVRYEDLILRTKESFVEILEFFQLTNIPDFELHLDFALRETDFDNLKTYEIKQGFVEKGKGDRFFRVGKANQWKDILTQDQQDKIVHDHKEMMEEFGYDC
jgi:hypothetical protein